jgi:hypothetical protein
MPDCADFVMYMSTQGGGWCNNVRACQFRRTSRRGSSDLMEKEIPFGGIMSSSPADNPGPSDDLTGSCSSRNALLINAHMLLQISTTGIG